MFLTNRPKIYIKLFFDQKDIFSFEVSKYVEREIYFVTKKMTFFYFILTRT